MDVWEHRILRGLRHSKMMVAVLSPAYFASDYCRKEWEIYVETELAQALPGDGIAPIYVVTHPAFDGQPDSVTDRLAHWIKDLKRRQYIEWRPFWPEGAQALERQDVRRRLDALPAQIAERLEACRGARCVAEHSPAAQRPLRGPSQRDAPASPGPDGQSYRGDHGGPRDSRHRQEHAGLRLRLGLRLRVSRRPVPDPGRQPVRAGGRRDRPGRAQGRRDGRRGAPAARGRPGQGQAGLRDRPAGAAGHRQPGRPCPVERPGAPAGVAEGRSHPRPGHDPRVAGRPPAHPLPAAGRPGAARRLRLAHGLPPDRRFSPGR